MADTWYCNLQGKEIGPLQLAALVQMSRNGYLNPGDRVRKGEHGIWAKASTVAGLFPAGEGDGLAEVSTLEELSIDIAGSTEARLPEATQPLPTIETGGMNRVGTVPTGPDVLNDPSERNWEFANRRSHNRPVARQPNTGRPHRSQAVPVEEWYCEVFGQTMGPMPFDDLKRMVDNDELSATDRVRQGESGTWITAASVSGLIPEDDFELSPAVVAPSPDAGAAPVKSAPPQPVAAPPPNAADPPPPAPVSSAADPASATEPSSTFDLNKWLDEETTDTSAPREPVDVTKTTAPGNVAKPSVAANAGKPVAAVPRKMIPHRPKRTRSRRSLSDLFAPVVERGKLLAMIGGGILVVGLLVLFVSSRGMTFFSHDKEYYQAYLSLYQEFRSLRDQHASEAQWSAFIEKTNQQNGAMLKQLQATASPKYPARQFLLFVARDNWSAMVATSRDKPTMDEWRLVTNLQSAHSRIEGSTAPPKPPKIALTK